MQKYEALLSDSDIGSAWYFSADSFAIEALGFLASKNISVPGHIAVAGFDDEPYSEMSCPPLTTTRQDVPRKGSVAFELLLELMAGKTPAANDVRLPVALVDRQSV
jgi:LacI family transcriptional regulator